jgi:hypothetical protein
VKQLPETENALMLRTDFTDDDAWTALCEAVREPSEDGFVAYVDCVSDSAYSGMNLDQIVALAPNGRHRTFAFIADRTALTDPELPVLVVDLHQEPGRTFRVIPREMWGVENNLSLGNMDYREFADNADADGVFRGFPP